MKFSVVAASLLFLKSGSTAFTYDRCIKSVSAVRSTQLHVSIGLGPDEQKDNVVDLVPGVDYEVPDHESFRTSRRSKLDEQCDKWFESLVGDEYGTLGSLAEDAKALLLTQVPLVNEVRYINV
jgi:hypothetical protein